MTRFLWCIGVVVGKKYSYGPFHDMNATNLDPHAVSEYSYLFRKAGERREYPNRVTLEVGEFHFMVPKKNWSCGPSCWTSSPMVTGGISDLEACCAVRAMLRGRECSEDHHRMMPCYRIVAVDGKRNRKKHIAKRAMMLLSQDPTWEANVVIAGGSRDASGLVVAARSALDAASDPKAMKLHVVVDADPVDFHRITTALACALGPGARFVAAPVNETFLAAQSSTFARVFAVEMNDMNRTRKNLVKAPANYIRLYVPAMFPHLKDKLVIYLDSDILVSADLVRLAAEATVVLTSSAERRPAVAGIKKASIHPEYTAAWNRRYPLDPRNISVFNAGVMIIDLQRWDALNLTAATEAWLHEYQAGGSQMPINLAVAPSSWVEVDRTWNCFIRGNNIETDRKYKATSQDACIVEPKIRHWTGRLKPWLPRAHLRFFWVAHAHRSRSCLDGLPHLLV